jgi:hypothetical protein
MPPPPYPPTPNIEDIYRLRRRELPITPAANPDIPIPTPPRTLQLNDPSGRFTGRYDPNVAQDVISGAKRAGVDPMTGLAMALQETGLGKYGSSNPLTHMAQSEQEQMDLSKGVQWHQLPPEGQRLFNIDEGFSHLNQMAKMKRVDPADEELTLQAYNGMGAIPDQPMYGGQTGLIGRRDRPYGKAVIGLRENILRPNSAIQSLIDIYGK